MFKLSLQGAPTGGVIVNYLLEKSRLCQQAAGERNFHVFYQLLAGASPETLEALELTANTETYFYLTQVRGTFFMSWLMVSSHIHVQRVSQGLVGFSPLVVIYSSCSSD